jgi:acyl-CoA synthetase (AMP-forming)/AMP-acid ligase II
MIGNDIPVSMKLDNWLSQRSQSCPDRTALVADGSQVSYAELEAETTWVARRLAAHGVRRGSLAALTMQPRREQVVLMHALMKVGAVLLPLNPHLTPEERALVLRAGKDLNHDVKDALGLVSVKTYQRWLREQNRAIASSLLHATYSRLRTCAHPGADVKSGLSGAAREPRGRTR